MPYDNFLKKRFAGKKVLIMGLGLQGGGVGAARFFSLAGARVTITDKRKREELASSLKNLKGLSYKLVSGRHRLKDFLDADIIFKNPGVRWDNPYLLRAEKKNTEILTEPSVFFDFFPREKIIGVTGTKGKSTTSALIFHCLKKKFSADLAGIPQTSAFSILLKKKRPDFVVYELSSFNLENLRKSPRYAVITSFFPDHLNRHGDLRGYWEAKKNIFQWQEKGDKLFLPKADAALKKLASSIPSDRIKFFKRKEPRRFGIIKQCVNGESFGASYEVLKIIGFTDKELKKFYPSFRALEGRMEYLGTKRGIIFINDTCATNPSAAASSINEIKKFYGLQGKKIIIILGGVDKGLSYESLETSFPFIKFAIILPGTASKNIAPLLRKRRVRHEKAADLKKAVRKAVAVGVRGDIIMLSPAAASFNLFQNEFDRGRQFQKLVSKINF